MSETEIRARPRVITRGLSPSPTQIDMRRRAAVSVGPSDAVFGCRGGLRRFPGPAAAWCEPFCADQPGTYCPEWMPLIPEPMNPLPAGRVGEVEDLLAAIAAWAADHADVRAVALVGSWARGAAHRDSDVDIVLLTVSPDHYVESEDWLSAFGAQVVVRTKRWGVSTERRVTRPSGLEVDVGVVPPTWASVSPVDHGTAGVATDGLVIVYDPDGALARLVHALETSRPAGPFRREPRLGF